MQLNYDSGIMWPMDGSDAAAGSLRADGSREEREPLRLILLRGRGTVIAALSLCKFGGWVGEGGRRLGKGGSR